MATPESWPQQPFRLIAETRHASLVPQLPGTHAAVRTARLMALTHNTVFRALNAIHLQSPAVSPDNVKDVADLGTFAGFALDFLDNHHTVEEIVFFPMLEAQTGIPGLMAGNVQQHREFDASVRSLRQYVEHMKAGSIRLDPSELRRRIEILAGPLQIHLDEEIPSLLALGDTLEEDMINTCYKAMHDEAEGTTSPAK
jgi:hemerythrin-like domain-containing protein